MIFLQDKKGGISSAASIKAKIVETFFHYGFVSSGPRLWVTALETVVPQISFQLWMFEVGNGRLNKLYSVAPAILGTTAGLISGKHAEKCVRHVSTNIGLLTSFCLKNIYFYNGRKH